MIGLDRLFLAGALAVFAAVASTGAAEAQRMSRTIVVDGTGTASAVPDVAAVSAGVETAAETAAAALAENSEAMRALFAELATAGVERRDIRTSDFSISPRYPDYRDGGGTAPRIVGYVVNNNVTVTVRKIEDLGRLIDALVRTGANRINSIEFRVADEASLLAEARRKAVADATARARLYAEAAGVTLGPVVRIDDTGSGPSPRPQLRAMAMEASAPPIAEGENTITASVKMTFRIGGRDGQDGDN